MRRRGRRRRRSILKEVLFHPAVAMFMVLIIVVLIINSMWDDTAPRPKDSEVVSQKKLHQQAGENVESILAEEKIRLKEWETRLQQNPNSVYYREQVQIRRRVVRNFEELAEDAKTEEGYKQRKQRLGWD